jgi:hypothetical protein
MNDNRNDDSYSSLPDFDTMTPAQFEHYLPEFFGNQNSRLSADPGLRSFLERNPDCAALVRDLEAIADAAKDLLPIQEPSDAVWTKIKQEIGTFSKATEPRAKLD